MKTKVLALLLALMLCFCGCAARQQEPPADGFRLYYCVQEDGVDVLRWSAAEPDLAKDTDTLLQICFAGLNNRYSASPMSSLFCVSYAEDNGTLTVYPNDRYGKLSDSERILADACISLTMLQLDAVQSVRIVCGGNENEYREDSIVLKDESVGMREIEVCLYFAYGGSRLSKETACLVCSDLQRLPVLTMQALLRGPSDQKHYSMIPEKTRLLDLFVDDGICTVVLSEEFAEADESAQRASLAVRSVAATLCELDGIDAVRIRLPDGSGFQHLSLDEPRASEAQWIK